MKIDVRKWKKHEDDTYSDLKYSYIKKKGKHKRAKTTTPNKKL